MTDFRTALDRTFPGALTSTEYLALVQRSVGPLGFRPDTTLPLISVCRDELTSLFFEQIQHHWGRAFTLAGLGGVPALGRTGWRAALSHSPTGGGRGQLIVFGFPHIGIEADSSIGVTVRPGQAEPTPTCGALVSIYDLACRDALPSEVDVADYEATRLALRLVDPDEPPSSLVDLTIAALDALEIDLWDAIEEFDVWRDHDVTIWCGVQVHGPGGVDHIWPRDAWYATADGRRHRIAI